MLAANDLPPNRRAPVRIDAQDGPWSVSVAESPHDARSYSLYIKTPTHNITLTRTAMEIVELDSKLRESLPGAKLPILPIDAAAAVAPKRKSTFLNTLSRLTSPTAGKGGRNNSIRRSNNASSIIASPVASPSNEKNDPFLSFTPSAINATLPTTVNSTAVAAYLTTISNTPSLRQARVWKRFVRVRTDDLESVRVERAIKHVRSDLAAHVGLTKDKENTMPSIRDSEDPIENGSIHDEKLPTQDADHETVGDEGGVTSEEKSPERKDDAPVENDVTTLAVPSVEPSATPNEKQLVTTEIETPCPSEEDAQKTPVLEGSTNRIPRSRSADPDKSRRLVRTFTSSTSNQDGTFSQTETGDDESSASAKEESNSRRRMRKKRSMSIDPALKKKSQRKVIIDDFEMMRVLGKGCAGKVLLVRHKSTQDLYALKAITKRHVLAHQELQHTLTEQAVLKKMAAEAKDPFVVKLWWSFHDKENLFLVMDFHPGGDLATQLARWGRLGRDRARFYAAEIVEGVEGLHAAGIIYRDLKPENILIGSDGHIVLTDFGLSKEFPRHSAAATAPPTPSGSRGEFYSASSGPSQPPTPPWMKTEKGGELAAGWPGPSVGQNDSTATFCGTAEYLAPEVIQGLAYSYEIDWWSFGTMLYEMLTGITPFWANNHADMYVRVLQDDLHFPDDRAIDQDTKSLIRGLLQRNPGLRICEPRIKRHPYFSMIDWSHVYYKRYIPPYIPPIDPLNASDTQNFDDTFLDMEPVLDEFNENEQTDDDQEHEQTDTDRTDGEETTTTPSQSRSSSIAPHSQPEDDSVDVFDGYSFKGRHSVVIDDEGDEVEVSSSESETDEEELVPEEVLPVLEPALEPETPKPETEMVFDETEADLGEPKTPEARPMVLAPDDTDVSMLPPLPQSPVGPSPPRPEESVEPTPEPTPQPPDAKARKSKELDAEKDVKVKLAPASKPAPKPNSRVSRAPRREKSGVAALDRYLSDGGDEDTTTDRFDDDEDDDWDFVEAGDGEDRNGTKGTSYFARGVVDRYRLAVFRKASTPSHRSVGRSFSGVSKASTDTSTTVESPSPTQRRGRNQGLTFRKHPRQFLRPKSPPSSYSSKSGKSLNPSASATLTASSSAGLLTPSPSMSSSMVGSHSLKSKESATSVGNQSLSDQSVNGADSGNPDPHSASEATRSDGPEKKTKKLKKYKENAERVFSLFSSPRQPQSQ
ncbi:kinase-like protein [Guyanagaster necrorhizus]|uniref:non-specific serine/threonine protein kinase n=1 Tax=Guyanagaster necrorhizus TaxID=856835 RepID=A0A9P7W3L6_9AGAR|nr:kinase-like protein [Guyanagaster necrorhizus MCA 3950]KAG7451810.1 kinase-like protein [Guyanagaster necrorhizus MCA 3950]